MPRSPVHLTVIIAAILFGSTLRADVILDWNHLMLDCIRADNSGPTLSTRNLAILNTALHDAVQSVIHTHQPYRSRIEMVGDTSVEAAAMAAAHRVTSLLYPSQTAWTTELRNHFLASATPGEALDNGLALGHLVGSLAIEARTSDGSNTEVPYIPSGAPGNWQRTPPFFRPPFTPHWRYTVPFCLPEIEPFVPGPPPALNSPEYAVALQEVQELGGVNSAVRTAEQSQIAIFWSDFSYTSMPPGHWHEIAASIAHNLGNTLADNARMFALLSLAQADASIVCWEAKYRYNLWRPVTAIRRANEDGNPSTEADTDWDHFLVSPPFPSYTSGHSTYSKAAAQALTRFYGTDSIQFTAGSDSLPGIFRNYNSLAGCADEIGMSRVYGGIHFGFDNVAGKMSGKLIADHVCSNFLLPHADLPRVALTRMEPGMTVLRVHAEIGRTVALEVSSEFGAWELLDTVLGTPGGVDVLDPNSTPETSRFYRAIQP